MEHAVSLETEGNEEPTAARNFIAVQACETCRAKKTRCDEDTPCSLCRNLGIQCVYKKRQKTRKEASLSMVMSAMRRMESKLERITTDIAAIPTSIDVTSPIKRTSSSFSTQGQQPETVSSMEGINHDINTEETSPSLTRTPISFSQHQALHWPVFQHLIPNSVFEPLTRPTADYAVDMEMQRTQLTMDVSPYPTHAGATWLETLSLSMITGLSEAYFATYNLSSPVLDKDAYFNSTISTVLREGFGYSIESCVVLNVLALGCMAVQGYRESNYPLPRQQRQERRQSISSRDNHFEPPEWLGVVDEYHTGLRFFNEGRRRIGAVICGNDLQSSQLYLLSGEYYFQIIRPTDAWAMFNRACICCLTMLKSNAKIVTNDWEGDMQCRVFWTALMFESILIQELNLPSSGLREFESSVPIPKFTPFPHRSKPVASPEQIQDDTFFQFHFLAQVAHRILLSRIRHSIFFYSESETFPTHALVQELYHQLAQWRASLPERIQFENTLVQTIRPKTPMHAFVAAILHTRYKVAKFHIGRPFFYKALHNPSSLSSSDLVACHEGLVAAMDWPHTLGICRSMPSLMLLKFATCSQFFGQLLLFWGLQRSPDIRVRETLPPGYELWCEHAKGFLRDCAPWSAIVAQDLIIVEKLYKI